MPVFAYNQTFLAIGLCRALQPPASPRTSGLPKTSLQTGGHLACLHAHGRADGRADIAALDAVIVAVYAAHMRVLPERSPRAGPDRTHARPALYRRCKGAEREGAVFDAISSAIARLTPRGHKVQRLASAASIDIPEKGLPCHSLIPKTSAISARRACKPDSVPGSRPPWMTIHLDALLPKHL